MKRLYILGNGFDVAHKLPTAYLDYRKFLKGSIENKDRQLNTGTKRKRSPCRRGRRQDCNIR